MYPAVEINLRLHHVCPVQPWIRVAFGYAFLSPDKGGENLTYWSPVDLGVPGGAFQRVGAAHTYIDVVIAELVDARLNRSVTCASL
jgi:hypothetical protein